MKNRFNCVVMKHQSAEKIQRKLMGLSLEEELEFWKKRSIDLKAKKKKLKESKLGEINV